MDAIHKTATKDENYLLALKALRSRNFSRNLPFLLLSDKLPEGQVCRDIRTGILKSRKYFL